jgi:hypothetical protein
MGKRSALASADSKKHKSGEAHRTARLALLLARGNPYPFFGATYQISLPDIGATLKGSRILF